MTDYYQLTPNPNSAFQFSPVLDGTVYSVTVPFLGVGQRYYIDVQTLAGEQIVYRSVIASPAAIVAENISWSNGYATITTISPHYYSIGDVVKLTISNCIPVEYNGTFDCIVSGRNTIRYQMQSNPGSATTLGTVVQNINLLAGYFTASTMIFRDGTNTFEVNT